MCINNVLSLIIVNMKYDIIIKIGNYDIISKIGKIVNYVIEINLI